MRAIREIEVLLRARACRERRRIDLAFESCSGIRDENVKLTFTPEVHAGFESIVVSDTRIVATNTWPASDRGPGVERTHLERVHRIGQVRIGDSTGWASGECAAVEAAFERRGARIAVAECHRGSTRVRRFCRDRRVGNITGYHAERKLLRSDGQDRGGRRIRCGRGGVEQAHGLAIDDGARGAGLRAVAADRVRAASTEIDTGTFIPPIRIVFDWYVVEGAAFVSL